MQKQTTLILLFLILVVGVGATGIFLALQGQKEEPSPQQTELIEAAKAKLLANAVEDAPNSFTITEKRKYFISYEEREEYFLIGIQSTPFDEIREEAEQAFLELLGEYRDVACDLDVRIGATAKINPQQAGQVSPWSLCVVGK